MGRTVVLKNENISEFGVKASYLASVVNSGFKFPVRFLAFRHFLVPLLCSLPSYSIRPYRPVSDSLKQLPGFVNPDTATEF